MASLGMSGKSSSQEDAALNKFITTKLEYAPSNRMLGLVVPNAKTLHNFIEEILVWLPMELLCRFRLVSK